MNQKLKVMHVITRLDMGGSAQNTLLTCIELAGRYDPVLVYGLAHESGMTAAERRQVEKQLEVARSRGVTVSAIPALVRRIDPLKDIAAFLTLLQMVCRVKPDIVHTHTSKAGTLGRLAAVLCGVPVVIHTPHGHVFYGHFGPVASKFFLLLEKFFDRFTHFTVALTQGEKRDYIELSVTKAHKIKTIHSGIDVDRFGQKAADTAAAKQALGLDPTALTVGTVGWLQPVKGPNYLMAAMAEILGTHPDTQLVFVGKGELEAKLRTAADRINAADKTFFWGWRDDIPDVMQAFDIFVLPSLNEGMGRVVVEAMAAGKPVIASRVGGIPDLVKHGVNGLLVAPASPRELAHAIEKLLEDPELRARMGRNGRVLAADFSIDKMVEKIDRLYTQATSIHAMRRKTDSR